MPRASPPVLEHGQDGHGTIVAIGAAIKFHSGKVVPSPRWASKGGLEWFWRLLREPRTVWRRALVYGPQFMALSLLDLMRHRRKSGD